MEKLINNKCKIVAEISLFSVFAFVVSFLKVPLFFFAAPMYKLDLSESIVMLGALCLGSLNGVIIALVRLVISVILKGSRTLFLSELTDFFCSATLAYVSALFIHKNKGNKLFSILIGSLAGIIFRTFLSAILNYYVLIPAFSKMFSIPISGIIKNAHDAIPMINSLFSFVILIVVPFNLVKSIISCVISTMLYGSIKRIATNQRHTSS